MLSFCLPQIWKGRLSGEAQALWGWSACLTWRADPIQTGEGMLLGTFNSSPSTYKESLRRWRYDSQIGARQKDSSRHKVKQKKRNFFLRVQAGSGEVPDRLNGDHTWKTQLCKVLSNLVRSYSWLCFGQDLKLAGIPMSLPIWIFLSVLSPSFSSFHFWMVF